jgi:hypothetical protein
VAQAEGSVYVYGILSPAEGAPEAVSGVAGSGVRTIDGFGLTALVSDLEGDSLMAAREVRAHWGVLERASQGATVLPVRFGTVMESDTAVRERLLGGNADRLTSALRDIAGRVQLSVKGEYDEEALLRAVVRGAPEIAALREHVRRLPEAAGYFERIRLGELVAAAIARQKEADTAGVLERLEPHAETARVEAPQDHAALHVAFLVARDGVERFNAEAAALADAVSERVQLRCIGPLPPYSFVEPDLLTGSAAWD